MLPGVSEMLEAISDTGPILHLHEIGRLFTLNVFERLYIPRLVAGELGRYGLDAEAIDLSSPISIVPINKEQRDRVLGEIGQPPIHPTDTEVLILAHEGGFSKPILTDDMALRRELEFRGALVIGSVGLLVRAYNKALMARADLDHAIDALFDESTLHLSSAFRGHILKLINDLGKAC